MMELLGVPPQVLFGQLLLGLINGSFYALLSLGLAVIFGMLNVINFAHGAQYMLGAFAAWMLLKFTGIGYWWALILAPVMVGLIGVVLEKLMLSRLYKLDHLYGLLLTFGLALIIEGMFRHWYGVSGQPYPIPKELAGGYNLGFMFLPTYRAWVVIASVVVCFGTWFVIERTKLGAYLRAATENPVLVQAFGINVPVMITATYGVGVALAGLAGVLAAPDLSGQPADGVQPDHRGLRGRRDRRHGLDPGGRADRLHAGRSGGLHQGVLPGSLQHRDLRRHGGGAADQARRSVRTGEIAMATQSHYAGTAPAQRQGGRR